MLWSHDRVHKQVLDEEWTSEDGDVKIVPVKFSAAHKWNTTWNQQSWIRVVRTGRETRGIEHKSRTRWISSRPSSIGIVTTPRVTTKEKLNSGMMVVTRWTKCHGNDETARVRQSRMCRVAFEASSGLDRAQASESRRRSHGGDVRMCVEARHSSLCTDD